ncbi:MAG: PAS domain-containing sensor histidine kinase [Pseudomonadota bacterium]
MIRQIGGRRSNALLALLLVGLAPVLVLLSFVVLGLRDPTADSTWLRAILLIDLVYILAVATLVVRRVTQIVAARRAQSVGSQLHLRLTGIFTGIALIPTILTAVFATVTINIGLEGWFSDRVRSALGNSVEAAQAYAQEQRDDLIEDAQALAGYLDYAKRAGGFLMADGDLRQLLGEAQDFIQRGLEEAFVINGRGEIRARGDRSYYFDYEPVSPLQIIDANEGATLLIEDQEINEYRALIKLNAYTDRYLYVTRIVDGDILRLLDETEATVQLYQQLEADRGRLLFDFGLIYLGFALILILVSSWVGLWFSERLSRPVGQLAGAAQRVGQGDLDIRVAEETGDDEIAMLSRIFNQMTRQLKGQRDALVQTNAQTERRRRLFDSVLGSVTAGVAGLDADGRIDFLNRSAQRLLGLDGDRYGVPLGQIVPEFTALFDRLRAGDDATVQEEIRLARQGRIENLLVRIATRPGADGRPEGYVVAFDDVTDLVSAQRMAAWGDVARRIAHEIKNPLTPIRLSAERLKRRFQKELSEESAEKLGDLTDVIVRQTEDLRRIVDEFSQFARMPAPQRQRGDLAALLRETVTLQSAALEPVTLRADIPDGSLMAEFDPTMMGQAFTNLIKNADEAIETRGEKMGDGGPQDVSVTLRVDGPKVEIAVADTGIGLPEDRAHLFEPYVTTREKGTGLGLPIVKKIIEEHGGTLELLDSEPDHTGHQGAKAVIRLPRIEEG